MSEAFLSKLAESGPFALVAGFLLWYMMRAWTEDRKQVTSLLTEFRAALVGLTAAVSENTAVMRDIRDEGKHAARR